MWIDYWDHNSAHNHLNKQVESCNCAHKLINASLVDSLIYLFIIFFYCCLHHYDDMKISIEVFNWIVTQVTTQTLAGLP